MMTEKFNSPDYYIYDATLTRIDYTDCYLVFTAGGEDFTERPSTMDHWAAGRIGRLRPCTHPLGFTFDPYADQRLRRDVERDSPINDLWGWRLGDRRFRVLAGVLPGLNGEVIALDTEKTDIDVPREFITLCAARNVTPERALRAYVADLCGLFNMVRCPREDGYSSNGSDERKYAQMHFNRAFFWGDDV